MTGKEKEKKVNILMVDEDEYTKIFFKDIFWLHGLDEKFELTMVNSAGEAEKILKDKKDEITCVFFDLVMSVEKDGRSKKTPEGGLAFLKSIKDNPELKKVKMITLSTFDVAEYEKKAKDQGVDMFLHKSEMLPQDFVEVLNKLYDSVK